MHLVSVLVTLIYVPAAYHDQLEIISAGSGHRPGCSIVWPQQTRHVCLSQQASYVQLPIGFSHK